MSACPACGYVGCHDLWTVTPLEAARSFVSDKGDRERFTALTSCIRRLWGTEVCTVRECVRCKFGFADPFVAGDVEFYALSAPREGYPQDRWEYGEVERTLAKFNIRGGRILEIGAGPGQFLRKVVPKFFAPGEVTAFEYNSRSIPRLQAAGYNAFQGDFRLILSREDRFHAVFMFQVLEHLDNQEATFSSLAHLLEPGGHLFISVPNPDRIQFNERTGSLRDMPPNHIGRYREETFRRLADANDLTFEGSERAPLSVAKFLQTDVGYYYLRRASIPGTLAHWVRSKRDEPYGKLLMRAMGAAYGPLRVATWLKYAPDLANYGDSLLVHLRRKSSA